MLTTKLQTLPTDKNKRKRRERKKERKSGAGFSCLPRSKIHVILDSIINVTLVLCFINECKRFANGFDVAFVLYFVNKIIPAYGLICNTLTVVCFCSLYRITCNLCNKCLV